MVYIGLARYTERDIKKIVSMKPTGVILGDILCNKRMFPFGGEELNDYILQFAQKGIKTIYQTPMYMTDRIFEKEINSLRYYCSKGLISGVIVQDVGVACKIHKLCPEIDLIWGRMGYARTPITNLATILFYMNCGVTGFECESIKRFNIANQIGSKPYLVYGWPQYDTINRECYYKFEKNIFDGECCCGCLKKEKMILGSNQENTVTIDGHVLGFKVEYIEECIEFYTNDINFIIYGENIETVSLYMSKLEEGN